MEKHMNRHSRDLVIQPKFEPAIMHSASKDGETVVRIPVKVQLWKDVGLCIHREKDGWRISQYDSGKYVLKNIKTRREVIESMMKLRNLKKNWSKVDDNDDVKDKVLMMRRKYEKAHKDVSKNHIASSIK